MREYCESTCGDQQWDTGLGTFESPCNSDLWSSMFWLADQEDHDDHDEDHHDDHYDDHHYDDHYDDHHDDHYDGPDSWSVLLPDEVIFLFCVFCITRLESEKFQNFHF